MARKLNAGDKNLLRLIARDAADGWVTTSQPVHTMLEQVPAELIELHQTKDGGLVRLTEEGRCVVKAMDWL